MYNRCGGYSDTYRAERMLDKSYAAIFRELQWLANYYDTLGQKEKAREIRDSLVNYYVKNNREPSGNNGRVANDEDKNNAYGQ